MLTKAEAKAHDRKLWRLLAWELVAWLILLGGFALGENRLREFVLPLGIILTAVTWLRSALYVLDDLQLRGANPLWAFTFGGLSGFVIWLLWRHWHPIPTTDTPRGRSAARTDG